MTPRPRRIGLLGGTFDPVHVAHLHIAACALHDLRLDEVRFIPAGLPPHKVKRDVTDAEHRVKMLELATSYRADMVVDPIDLGVNAPSYTSDLLARLRQQHPDDGLWFIVGADSLKDFPSWHQPERILHLARLAVAERPGWNVRETLEDTPLPLLRSRVNTFSSVPIELSSTAIRDRINVNKPIDGLVPPEVRLYMARHHLYEIPF